MRLGRIGFDNVAGYLDGGMQALATRPDLVQRIERITAPTLAEQLEEAEPIVVLDVRTEREWQNQHIEGSLNIPLQHLQERLAEAPIRQVVVTDTIPVGLPKDASKFEVLSTADLFASAIARIHDGRSVSALF